MLSSYGENSFPLVTHDLESSVRRFVQLVLRHSGPKNNFVLLLIDIFLIIEEKKRKKVIRQGINICMWFQMISSARSAVDFDNGDKDEELDDYCLIMIMTVTMMIKMKCSSYAAAQDCVTIRQDISFSAWKTGGRSN